MLTTIKLFKKWLTTIASVLAFLIFAFVSLPIIMDSNSVQKVLSSFIADKLRKGVYLTPENMFLKGVSPDRVTFSVFPFPSIELSDVKITSSPLQNSTIEKVFISFSPDSFIKKKFL